MDYTANTLSTPGVAARRPRYGTEPVDEAADTDFIAKQFQRVGAPVDFDPGEQWADVGRNPTDADIEAALAKCDRREARPPVDWSKYY